MTDSRQILRLNIRHYEALLGLDNMPCLSVETRGMLAQLLDDAKRDLARLESAELARESETPVI